VLLLPALRTVIAPGITNRDSMSARDPAPEVVQNGTGQAVPLAPSPYDKLHALVESLAQQGDRNGALNVARRGIGCNICCPKSLPLLYNIGLGAPRDIQATCTKDMRCDAHDSSEGCTNHWCNALNFSPCNVKRGRMLATVHANNS
jgi:hypothetical protein